MAIASNEDWLESPVKQYSWQWISLLQNVEKPTGDVGRSRTAIKDEVKQRVDVRDGLFILRAGACGLRPFPTKGIAAAAAAAQAAAQVAEANAAAAAAVAAHAKVMASKKEQQDSEAYPSQSGKMHPERKKDGGKDTKRDDEAGKEFDLTESEEIIEEVGSYRPC